MRYRSSLRLAAMVAASLVPSHMASAQCLDCRPPVYGYGPAGAYVDENVVVGYGYGPVYGYGPGVEVYSDIPPGEFVSPRRPNRVLGRYVPRSDVDESRTQRFYRSIDRQAQ